MEYEYKTISVYKPEYDDYVNEVSEKLNDLSSSGWEYIDNITPGQYRFAILVFRRKKQ
jgi:hypothetical protein